LTTGFGLSDIAIAAGVLGAMGGVVATGVSGPLGRWIPILLPALLGAFMVMCDIDRTPNLAVSLVTMTCVGGCVGWMVATIGGNFGASAALPTPKCHPDPPPAR
jgi:hypothetical protein